MSDLITRSFNSVIIGQRVTDGYINATAMCKASGKKLGHYLENQITQAFLEALSADIGIPISTLVQIRKGGKPELQGTWVYPYIAVNLGQWCSPQFAVLVSKWVHEWMATGKKPDVQSPQPSSNVELGNFGLAVAKIEILAQWLDKHNVHLIIKDQAKLNALAKACPEDEPIIDVFKRVLESIAPQQSQDLSPTQLAESLTEQLGRKISAQKVNLILEELDFQYKLFNGDDWRWDLTDKGKEFGKIYLVTGKGNQWSGGQLKWSPDVINLILPHLGDSH